MRTSCGIVLVIAAVASSVFAAEKRTDNLARKAKVTATSEFNGQYAAVFVADGMIPPPGRRDGVGQEWAVNGKTHRDGAELTMEWPEPVTIAEVVYYGRTSFAVETWKKCEVYLDDANKAAAQGEFQAGHGPQRVKLTEPATAKKLRLKFIGSHGCRVLRDYDGTKKATLIEPTSDGMGYYSPQPIRAVEPPPVIPSQLPETDRPWATVVVQDVYNGLGPDVERGEIKQIAVCEEIEKGDFAPHKGIFGFQFPLVSCGATYAAKKLWGYATVEEDGSAHFEVPTGIPVYFLALDDKGRAVQRMRSFTHFQPGEQRNCIGCHADRNYASPRNTEQAPIAALRLPEPLAEPEWGRRKFDYSSIAQPVLDKYCVECHETVPRKFYTRITNIEQNNFLAAPLAEAAGGWEVCPKKLAAACAEPGE